MKYKLRILSEKFKEFYRVVWKNLGKFEIFVDLGLLEYKFLPEVLSCNEHLKKFIFIPRGCNVIWSSTTS